MSEQSGEIMSDKDGLIEQLRVQLAGVGVAAAGGINPEHTAKRGDWGWSVAYQDVLDLRIKHEEVLKSKDTAYFERNLMVLAIARIAKARGNEVFHTVHDVNDKDWEQEWRTILVIELPTGQVTWHFHESQISDLDFLMYVPTHGYKWDGHTTEEKYDRLIAWTKSF